MKKVNYSKKVKLVAKIERGYIEELKAESKRKNESISKSLTSALHSYFLCPQIDYSNKY